MAKLLTCEVALSDGTEQYYALESYVMQCLLKMAGCTNPTIVSDSDSWGVHGDSGKDNYTLLFIDDSISKKNNCGQLHRRTTCKPRREHTHLNCADREAYNRTAVPR